MKTNLSKRLARAFVLAAVPFASLFSVHATIVGQWDFKSGDLSATTGQALEYFDGAGAATSLQTVFGTTTNLGLPGVGGQVAHVMGFPRSINTMGYVMHSNMGPNGGGSLVNQYTVVFDLLYTGDSANSWRALLQIDDPGNGTDADFFINPSGGIGISSVYQGTVASNAWQRVAIAVDLAAVGGPLARKYLNGVFVGQQILSASIDGRWAISPSGGAYPDQVLLFTDNNPDGGENAPGYVSSIQVHDTALSQAYIGALGAASGDAIPATVKVPVSIVSRQPAPGAFNIMTNSPVIVALALGSEPFDSGTIALAINGQALASTVTSQTGGYLVSSTLPPGLAARSVNTLQISWTDSAVGGSVTQQWSFSMIPYAADSTLEASLTKGVTAYWPMNEGLTNVNATILHDIGRGNDCTLISAAPASAWLTGANAKFGSALYLDERAVVMVSTNAPMDINTNEVTLAAWVKLDALPSALAEAYGSIYDSAEDSYILYLDRANKELRFKVTAANGAARPGIPESQLTNGNWLHVVGVYNGNASSSTGSACIYLNGQPIDTHMGDDSTFSGLTGLVKAGQAAAMGQAGVASNSFLHGAMDDVAVWRRALTVDEIGYLAAGHAVPVTGRLDVPASVTQRFPAAGAVNVLPGTTMKVALTQGSEVIDTNSFIVMLNGQTLSRQVTYVNGVITVTAPLGTPPAGVTNTIRLQWKDPVVVGTASDQWTFRMAPYGDQPALAAAVTNLLVAYWKLDDALADPLASVLKDSVGQNDGALTSPDPTLAWLSGTNARFGGALAVDGQNTYGQIPNTPALNISNNQVTVSAWVKLRNLPSQNVHNFGGIFDSDQDDYVLYLDKANKELRFKVTDVNGGAARPGIPEAQLTTNVWLHVLGLYDGRASATAGQARVYLNGQLAATLALGTNNVRPGQIAYIGRGASTTYNLNAVVDDVAVWSRALTSDEIGYLAVGHAVISTEVPAIHITSISVQGQMVTISWSGGTGTYQLQRRASLTSGAWENVGAPTTATTAQDPLSGTSMFYRVQAQ